MKEGRHEGDSSMSDKMEKVRKGCIYDVTTADYK